jgi:hypothetical protein
MSSSSSSSSVFTSLVQLQDKLLDDCMLYSRLPFLQWIRNHKDITQFNRRRIILFMVILIWMFTIIFISSTLLSYWWISVILVCLIIIGCNFFYDLGVHTTKYYIASNEFLQMDIEEREQEQQQQQ